MQISETYIKYFRTGLIDDIVCANPFQTVYIVEFGIFEDCCLSIYNCVEFAKVGPIELVMDDYNDYFESMVSYIYRNIHARIYTRQFTIGYNYDIKN